MPSATIETLKSRAAIIKKIRHFFAEREVMEVETPLLSQGTITDPQIMAMAIPIGKQIFYLQTSPEYAMKRLLAAGSGAIYQICKAFRQGDLGKMHNPEFTMLEWYQLNADHHVLMAEMDELLQWILGSEPAEKVSYQQIFQHYLMINPHTATQLELAECAKERLDFLNVLPDNNAWLDLLFTHCIAPHLGKDKPIFIYDFCASQAALAKIRFNEDYPVASRFEVYVKGIELANGFHELQDPEEQRQRFEKDLVLRNQMQLPIVPIDEKFLAALAKGLPDCAGVALGIDRLVMLALGHERLDDVISFGFNRS